MVAQVRSFRTPATPWTLARPLPRDHRRYAAHRFSTGVIKQGLVLFCHFPFIIFLFLYQRLSPDMLGDEGFFDLLSRFQSNRMDDQRCSVQDKGSRLNRAPESPPRTIRKCESIHSYSDYLISSLDFTMFISCGTFLILSNTNAAVSESANVSGAQGQRLEESSAAGGSLPGLRLHQNSNQAVLSHLMANADNAEPDDDFFDMLVKCQVPDRTKYSLYEE